MIRILVLGAGGVGGYYGGRLAEAGADVTFLVRPHRRQQLQRDGLRVDSPLGNLKRPVKTVVAGELASDYDFVLLTCKAYDLDSSMDAIAPAMGAGCTVVPLLNGLAHLERLDARFGADHVMGGTCGIDVTLLPDGVIRHTGTLQRIAFGERDRRRSPRGRALADAFSRTTLEWEWADDILMRMWEKIVLLSVLAATTCLFRGNVHEIMSAPGGREAAERALAANVEIARLEGYPQTEGSVRYTRERLTDPDGRWSASMMRDMEAGRPVEADHIIGYMLERARAHHVDADILSLAYTHLKTYETRRAEGRLPAIASAPGAAGAQI
jgi:2-dehydropantoate 2-reductase